MSWLKAVPIIGQLLLKAVALCERRQRKKDLKQQEQARDAIKHDPKTRHREQFGDSVGRVSVNVTSYSNQKREKL
ncbi:hypothetical protein AB4391_24040 [Vibrio lentus]|uniref:hypothetical protein n=1 Tax=Vibrio lentus TaxID=136468 RepID=UPI0018E4AA6F|nr:hypothetical protein [Vibrio lentus]